MKLGFDLKTNQSQKMIMTPGLTQAIELLQFNVIELNRYIKQELEDNLMLEIKEKLNYEESLDDKIDKQNIELEEYFNINNHHNYIKEINFNKDQIEYESFIKYEPTMNDNLLTQLALNLKDSEEIDIGRNLIQNLDEYGYLKVDLNSISDRLDVELIQIEKVLNKIQNLEPLGIGARDLKECLLLQVDENFKEAFLVKKIISNHLEDLAYNRINKIKKELDINDEELEKSIEYIRKLEPRPAKSLSDICEESRYIIPDAEIKLLDGRYIIIVNDITAPRLIINTQYRNMMKNSLDEEAVDYLNNRFNKAIWVIKSIEQRRNTIRKVIESILKFQLEFFLEGEKSLKPLTLKEVADDIEIHESTVSRVTTDKYVQTPKGLYELKYFFSSGIVSIDGDVSSRSIKAKIKDIIKNEDRNKPYSDQKISDILEEEGIQISRRTVAKYRNEMDILSSSMRRGF